VRAFARTSLPEPIALDFGQPVESVANLALPALDGETQAESIGRQTRLDTVIPDRASVEVVTYEVEFGDSVFGIAEQFEITPETLLWANYDILNDNPDFLEPGMVLDVPPINGVYYQWQAADSLEGVAAVFEADLQAILNWAGNDIDLSEPQIAPGEWLMIPGGQREFRQWVIPEIPRGNAGVSRSLYGPGACEGSYEGAFGSGAFIWPSPLQDLVGNDYWSGHLGIDIASGEGVGVYAADSGVVVFSGWANGGYGYMVMIDHGNGYQTLYAHLSQVVATCGSSVSQGQTIAYGGSSGNSTGPHLHFEIRFEGGFVNPWFNLSQ
jgi:murein DD-endopeptidase MepM/ murein hydrolase activator NlpD